jgi:isoquinoline 1-oxidoreductase subunit beta
VSGAPSISRRDVLVGGLFVLGFTLPRGGRALALESARPQPQDAAAAAADGNPPFAPNAFIRIDATGPIRLVMPSVEMGQGSYTGQATLICEELEVGLDQVKLEHAPPDEQLYGNISLQQQATGGSSTTRSSWQVLREAGAVGRTMLVTAAAKDWGVAPASCVAERGVVRHPPSGRSAPYGQLARAAASQPVPPKVILKEPRAFQLIGKPFRRLDTPGKVDGSTTFGIDVRVPDMKIATVRQCPSFSGRLRGVDDSAARQVPGVRDVVRLENAVAVIGDHFWAAKSGADALQVEWDMGPHADFSTAAMFQAMDHTSRTGASIVARSEGDLGHGGKRIEAVYQLPMLAHAPMEPLNALVHVRPDGCEMWLGTQVPTRCVATAAKITGLPPEKIVVHNQYLGGGFGRRLDVDHVQQAVEIAKAVPYPVKMVWTREQDIQHDIPRPSYLDRIAATVDGDGYPVVWTDRVTGDSVARRWAPQALLKSGLDEDTVEGADEPPYDLPNIKVEWVPYSLPKTLPIGWWRGVGPTHNLFVVESFIDELAHAAGKDPVAYRRRLLGKNPRALNCLNLAAEKIGWGSPVAGPRIGRGVAVGSPFGSHVAVAVEVEVSPEGEVRMRRAVAAIDCGIVINPNTVEAQIQGGLVFGWTGALYSQLTFEDGVAQQSNFNDYRMVRMNETPPVEVHIVQSEAPPGGMGEVGTAIAAPPLANAIFAATGVRFRSLPIDRARLVQNKAAGRTVLDALPAAALGAIALSELVQEDRPAPATEGHA